MITDAAAAPAKVLARANPRRLLNQLVATTLAGTIVEAPTPAPISTYAHSTGLRDPAWLAVSNPRITRNSPAAITTPASKRSKSHPAAGALRPIDRLNTVEISATWAWVQPNSFTKDAK